MGSIDTLTKFMIAWKNSNWSEMFENAQITCKKTYYSYHTRRGQNI
ncbi:unnamed protein product [marine sediment metagenome]|uniref:Uncharacterized protein n=1 Tax=marine sediment metagenome TaxID=412755 RepID=X1RJK4_9ZZZZ